MSQKRIFIAFTSAILSAGLLVGCVKTYQSEQKIIDTPIVVHTVTIKPSTVTTDKAVVIKFVNELMTKRQASCLLWIFEKESHTDPYAKNPTSSARGIGQLLASTYANIGLKHSADPMAQVVAAIAYISRHYGSDGACAAKAFWQKHYYW